ncbi:hypothetical protein B566_EDAN006656 [Ephemera danica]|nr:hypothetical protein B566_EDAN006656 [Ephemera danica]
MGCTNSKNNNKKTLNRLSQYHLAALQEAQGLVKSPIPLEDDEIYIGDALISLRSFHNLFYDGFYAPYVRNPDYLLLIDMRADKRQFEQERILTAKWHANVPELQESPLKQQKIKLDSQEGLVVEQKGGGADPLRKYCNIVLYDADGTSFTKPDSEIRQLCRKLRDRKLEPMCLAGGLRAVRDRCPYLLTNSSRTSVMYEGPGFSLSWFPSIILDGQLFLGRCDQASNPEVLSNLGVSHVVCTTHDGRNSKVRSKDTTRTLLLAPPTDEKSKKILESGGKSSSSKSGPKCLSKGSTDTLDDPSVSTNLLTDEMTKLTDFVKEAFEAGGRVLVQGELGVDRSAALVMALLMHQRSCSLEDAYYYVKRCRPTVQPSDILLKALAKFEVEIFGKRLTSIDDLCY